MISTFLQKLGRVLSAMMIIVLLTPTWGCALIVSQRKQTVRVNTTPPGRTVTIDGTAVKDGQSFTIKKDFKAAEANIGSANRPTNVELKYNPDVWLVGDAALLLFFVLPGLIALGVDFGSGAWRAYQDPQILVLSESSSPEVDPKAAQPPPPPEEKKAPPKPPAKSPPKPKPTKPSETPVPEPSPIQP